MRGGDRRDRARATWGRGDGQPRARALGCMPDTPPGAATGPHVLRQRDGALVEAALGAWVARVLTALPQAGGAWEALAIDGHPPRGRRQHGAPALQLRSARRPRGGRTRGQHAVAEKPQARAGREAVWRGLRLAGGGRTVEVWRTPRASAQHLVAADGDDVLSVKGPHPPWPSDSRLVFPGPLARTEIITACDTVDDGHGRLAEGRLTTRLALVGSRDGPGPGVPRRAACDPQAARSPPGRRGRRGHPSLPRPGETSGGVAAGPAALAPGKHAPLVRDVPVAAERSQGRWGSRPPVMAACRNTAIGLLHWAGDTRIAAACCRCAAQPWSA
jgi:hypothetical protein